MDNITIIEVTDSMTQEVTQHVIIERAPGEFTSMPKEVYDAQQAQEHSTEIVPPVDL